jgi:type VI secretion system protein ImpE
MSTKARELFAAGKVREAEQLLTAYLREKPADVSARTFLFELLCFTGDYARAEKQLAVLAAAGPEAETGAIVYYAALHAEKLRRETFERELFEASASTSPSGSLNGVPFKELRDADPDIGARLEVFAAGAYLWIPFEHVASLEMEAPRRLRDTLWSPAILVTGPSFRGTDLGEVLLPAIYPFSSRHPDQEVWLGRKTAWAADEQGKEYPSGQKLLLVDGAEFPFLEVRSLEFDPPPLTPADA